MMTLVTPATTSLLGLTETKNYIKVEHAADDDLIRDIIIPAAINNVENYCGYRTAVQVWKQYDPGGAAAIELYQAPINSIDSVTVYDSFDSTGTLLSATTDYRVVDNKLLSSDGYWDTKRDVDGYTIEYTVGSWETGDPRLAAIKQAALRCVSWLYENRSEYLTSIQEAHALNFDFNAIPAGAKALLNPFSRNIGF